MDIDFLIPHPRGIKKEVDVGSILKKLDFTPRIDFMSGLIKFSHPDLELEFLSPLLGKGEKIAIPVRKFKTNAIGLRFLNLLSAYPLLIQYEKLNVTVPEPAAYVLHKFIISAYRLNEDKRKKDRESALKIREFLLKSPVQKIRLEYVYNELPVKWQKKVLAVVKEELPALHVFLSPE